MISRYMAAMFAYLVFICLARSCLLDSDLDNEGTEFVLCYMDNSFGTLLDVDLYITTSSETQVNVSVSTPLYDPSFSRDVYVNRGDIQKVKIPAGIRGSGTNLENKGVFISASEDVTVYSINAIKFSTDAFVALPVDTLGTDYVIATWSTDGTFMLVSTEDGTNIQIHFSQAYREDDITFNNVTYKAGDTLTVTLNKWQTFHVYTNGDLTGTRVQSSQVITVMSGSQRTSVLDPDETQKTSSDHLVEQLLPVRSWGREFISICTPGRTIGDFLKVVAAENTTRVTLGTSLSVTLNAGEFHLFNLDSGWYFKVTANKGIMPVLFSKTTHAFNIDEGDPAMSLLVPIQLYQSEYTFSTVDTENGAFTNYLVIAIKYADKGGLMLDRQFINTTADWSVVEGACDYVVTTLNISQGVHSVSNNDPGARFLGMTFGNGDYNSYAYASGLRLGMINLPTTITSTTSDGSTGKVCGIEAYLIDAKTMDNFCSILNMSQSTNQLTLHQKVEEITNDLLIDQKKTSKARRRHTSATDDRLSGLIIGHVSAVFLASAIIGMLLLVDVVPSAPSKLKTSPEMITREQQMNQIFENELDKYKTSVAVDAPASPEVKNVFITEC